MKIMHLNQAMIYRYRIVADLIRRHKTLANIGDVVARNFK